MESGKLQIFDAVGHAGMPFVLHDGNGGVEGLPQARPYVCLALQPQLGSPFDIPCFRGNTAAPRGKTQKGQEATGKCTGARPAGGPKKRKSNAVFTSCIILTAGGGNDWRLTITTLCTGSCGVARLKGRDCGRHRVTDSFQG